LAARPGQLFQANCKTAQTAAILEVAMPTMLMAASFADRFKLDVRAAALTASWSSLMPSW
jgi:predicted permease